MPPRTHIAMVFVPETNQMQQDSCEMLRAIVIDARLREHHNLHSLQSMLMATCATPYPFPITQMNDKQYLLVLPPGIDREAFLNAHATHLRETGYVTFPWSASVNGTPLPMQFKVLVDLKGMAPSSWTVEHLLSAARSFGCVLAHAAMSNRASIERMRAVVVVPDLALVPENVGVWVRGILHEVHINVHAWIEEPIPSSVPPDTTPPMTFFEQARCNFSPNSASRADQVEGLNNFMVDFDTLFAIWAAMDSGTEKLR